MTTEQVWAGVAGAVALLAIALALLAVRRARRADLRLATLAERVALLEAAAVAPLVEDAADSAYLITRMHTEEPGDAGKPGDAGDRAAVPVARPIDGRLFADIVARESVVKAASWTHGLRRALSPENRNRIRFAVRQETRRATRERRSEVKQALRELRARERAGLADRRADRLGGRLGEDVA